MAKHKTVVLDELPCVACLGNADLRVYYESNTDGHYARFEIVCTPCNLAMRVGEKDLNKLVTAWCSAPPSGARGRKRGLTP